jgi:hypothetical protein
MYSIGGGSSSTAYRNTGAPSLRYVPQVTEIGIETLDEWSFRVDLSDGSSSSSHMVTIDPDWYEVHWAEVPTEAVVRASFRFLLDRESRTSILPSFDLASISWYFDDYPADLGRYLDDE